MTKQIDDFCFFVKLEWVDQFANEVLRLAEKFTVVFDNLWMLRTGQVRPSGWNNTAIIR